VLFHDPRFRKSYSVSGRVMLDGGFSWCIYEHNDHFDASRAPEMPSRGLKLRERP
jgi:hypothetical protein